MVPLKQRLRRGRRRRRGCSEKCTHRDDEGDDPPDGYDGGVEDFAATGDERRCTEDVHEDIVVENFDTDITI